VVLIFVLIIIGLFAFQYLQKEDWNHYLNDYWEFEISYPSHLDLNITIDVPEENMFGLILGEFRMTILDSDMEGQVKLYLIEGTEKEVTVGGVPGIFFHKEDMSGEKEYITQTLIKKGPVIYVFVGEGKEFQEILSTFQFK